MKKNMGGTDRLIRVVIALGIIGLSLAGILSGTLAIVLLVLSAVFLVTAIIGFCPLYAPLGINTCRVKNT